MDQILKSIRDWSEVWALLIPLVFIFFAGKNTKAMKPIVLYVWVGLFLSLISTVMFVYHKQMPAWLQNNNLIYNIHSIVRLIFFSWFISQFRFDKSSMIHYVLLTAYTIFIVINFILWDPPHLFSNTHFIAESIFLLAFTIIFFFRAMQDESDTDWIKQPAFIVCAGISLYEAVNFFTFLFFEILTKKNIEFLKVAWTIHNMSFVVLCIMLAIALYRSKRMNDPSKTISNTKIR